MKSRLVNILVAVMIVGLALVWNSCASQQGCVTCGTTTKGAYAIIDNIPVVEHNNTGEPGGPFASFDIAWVDPVNRLFYVTDRIGIAIPVIDTIHDVPGGLGIIGGANAVSNGGNNASPCLVVGSPATPGAKVTIPPIMSAAGNFTRFGCRTLTFTIPGFGANGLFGGWPGAQCCASRANSLNPLAGPNGIIVTPDGKTLFAGSGSSSVGVFDLTTNPATVIGYFTTGQPPDYDGPTGIAICGASANGRAFSDPTCGDLRGDEMSYGSVTVPAGSPSGLAAGVHDILLVTNGDPGFPFVTIFDVTDMVNRTYAAPFLSGAAGGGACLPVTIGNPYSPTNFPTCVLGQIYYDGANTVSNTVANRVDASGAPCPDPSLAVLFGPTAGTPIPSGVSGAGVGSATGVAGVNVPCHHGPILNANTGAFVTSNGTAGAGQMGAIAVAGLGGSSFNPLHNTFFVTNANSTVSGLATQSSVAVGNIDEIDPIGNGSGPVIVNSYPVLNCMPGAIVQGPGSDFLVGCADHDGIAFPPNEYIISGTTGAILATIPQTGGVDEVWYNPGDNRYYIAARDFPGGPQLGVIDAHTRQWLTNLPTNNNSHAVAADPINNHVFVPSQTGAACGTNNNQGCVLVIAQQ